MDAVVMIAQKVVRGDVSANSPAPATLPQRRCIFLPSAPGSCSPPCASAWSNWPVMF